MAVPNFTPTRPLVSVGQFRGDVGRLVGSSVLCMALLQVACLPGRLGASSVRGEPPPMGLHSPQRDVLLLLHFRCNAPGCGHRARSKPDAAPYFWRACRPYLVACGSHYVSLVLSENGA